MTNANFSPIVNDVLAFTREEALRLGSDFIGVEHIFLGILRQGDNGAIDILSNLEVSTAELRAKVEGMLKKSNKTISETTNIPLVKQAFKVIRLADLEARSLSTESIEAEHLLLAILRDENNIVTSILRQEGLTYEVAKSTMKTQNNEDVVDDILMSGTADDEGMDDRYRTGGGSRGKAEGKSATPVLDNFGRDLTKMAEEGRLDPIVGRDKEVERVSQILSRRKKNNPILIGEPGVGKSAIAEGLALRIVQRKVSRVLFNKRIVSLDLASLVAGTKYRGQFEERMKALMAEIEKSPDVILFIDEMHTIIGAGGASGSLDASNMFKPALARGEIQVIGATTLDEYRQYIEKDGALERRFQKVLVEPTTIEETVEILGNIKERYEEHHNVDYTEEAIEACVKLTDRYMSDRHLPDKAIDALDEVGSRVHITNINVPQEIIDIEKEIEKVKEEKSTVIKKQKFEEAAQLRDTEKQLSNKLEEAKNRWEEETKNHRVTVTEENVAEVVAMMTGIPVQRVAESETGKLVKMNEAIQGTVIGQDEAIKKVVKAIQRNRAGLKDPNKPIGSFFFLGPTGVGKTQLAKELAKYMFDTEEALIRIDMSEYMEKFSVTRLVGAPPGYVGYEEGGQLTEKVRRKPYSIVLLDEIEKAHPDVFNLLLQVLDDGHLTDGLGRKIDFKNTILIMTSNIGARQLSDFGSGVGFGTKAKSESKEDDAKGVVEKALRKAFAPEFLNRIDDMILFNSLSQEDIHKIIDIELKNLYGRIKELGYDLTISDPAKDYLATKGYDEKYGARPLKRVIQKMVEDPLAEEIIRSNLSEGDKVHLDLDKKTKEIKVNIEKKADSKD